MQDGGYIKLVIWIFPLMMILRSIKDLPSLSLLLIAFVAKGLYVGKRETTKSLSLASYFLYLMLISDFYQGCRS